MKRKRNSLCAYRALAIALVLRLASDSVGRCDEPIERIWCVTPSGKCTCHKTAWSKTDCCRWKLCVRVCLCWSTQSAWRKKQNRERNVEHSFSFICRTCVSKWKSIWKWSWWRAYVINAMLIYPHLSHGFLALWRYRSTHKCQVLVVVIHIFCCCVGIPKHRCYPRSEFRRTVVWGCIRCVINK